VAGDSLQVGGRRPVVALGDFGPIALLEDELLLGQQVVRVGGVELPDPVEDGELFFSVEAQVADQVSDVGPVLLLEWAPSFLLPGRDRVKVIAWSCSL
jgi:hypothetical protein